MQKGDQLDVLKAAQIVYDEGIAIPILIRKASERPFSDLMEEIEFDADIPDY